MTLGQKLKQSRFSATTMTATVCRGYRDCQECPLVNVDGYLAGGDAWLVYDCGDYYADRVILSNSDATSARAYVVACELKVLGVLLPKMIEGRLEDIFRTMFVQLTIFGWQRPF